MTLRDREKGKRTKARGLEVQRHAKTEAVVPEVRIVPVPDRGPAVLRKVEPGAPATNTATAPWRVDPRGNIVPRVRISVVPIVLTPLKHIAMHVIDPECVRRLPTNRMWRNASARGEALGRKAAHTREAP